MAKLYEEMTEAEIREEISSLRDARREILSGSGVAEIRGEGRAVRFAAKPDLRWIDAELRELYAVASDSGFDIRVPARNAIGVE